jgi:hypothetical protein
MGSGYDRIYSQLRPALAHCDLADSAQRLGLQLLPEGAVAVDFCGREYRITNNGVEPADGQPVHVNFRSILAHYVLSQGSGEPGQSWMTLNRMSGVPEGRKAHDKDMLLQPLLDELGRNYPRFEQAACRLGGVPAESNDAGHAWTFKILPKIPVRLVFYEVDEEFPAEIQLYFDRSASRFLGYECLAFLSGCFIDAILDAAQQPVAAH